MKRDDEARDITEVEQAFLNDGGISLESFRSGYSKGREARDGEVDALKDRIARAAKLLERMPARGMGMVFIETCDWLTEHKKEAAPPPVPEPK